VVAEEPGLGFAGLLRRLCAKARLTQEELAEAAGLSPRSVSDLERGIHRTARRHHAQALAIARDIGAPLEEARALEGLGRADLQDGSHGNGLELLRRAHTICQRIGAPPRGGSRKPYRTTG
jgi:transcriptional regulator with XRE-family HTH domain